MWGGGGGILSGASAGGGGGVQAVGVRGGSAMGVRWKCSSGWGMSKMWSKSRERAKHQKKEKSYRFYMSPVLFKMN